MANYCSNQVIFVGDVSLLKKEFERMQANYDKTQAYQLPEGFEEFKNSSGGHIRSPDFLFEVYITESDENALTVEYETRWETSMEILSFLAKKYEVEFYGCFVPDEMPGDYSGILNGVFDHYSLLKTRHFTISELMIIDPNSEQIHPADVSKLAREHYEKVSSNCRLLISDKN